MNKEEMIKNSEALIQWLDQKIDGLNVPSDERTRLAGACLDMALEHQKAMVLLVAKKLFGSAFALARLIFEAYVRGVWLQLCASEQEIQNFKNDKLEKNFSTLIREIEICEGFNNGILSEAKKANYAAMNSFTHSGYLQAVRRNTENTIEPNYTEEELTELVNMENAIGMLSALQITLLAGENALAIEMLEKSKIISRM